ncbi:class I SAM-dependent methyltransferase [Oscillatoria sp. FACHB-1407]|nr:class I SAM-dependent methyltransferase [Oscillatoria sp. FACHB-1407]
MIELKYLKVPDGIQNLLAITNEIKFSMVSEPLVGSLLRTLATSKPSGQFLELGTGTGVSTAWILSGMDLQSSLLTIDNDQAVVAIAKAHLKGDSRVTFKVSDAGDCINQLNQDGKQFDLIFADTWAGKYTHFEQTMQLLKPGGFYVIDDMLPQPNWLEGHELKVAALIGELAQRRELSVTKMHWASGVVVATKHYGSSSAELRN